jgi:hypothetical protein
MMDITMELDELKQAWQTLDRRLQQQNTLQLLVLRKKRIEKIQSVLRPMFWGQIVSILFGICMILLAISVWPLHSDVPHLLIAGILVHMYGLASIIGSGIIIGMLRGIDHAASVLDLQRQLAKLRRVRIIVGMCSGLSWWLLWVPITMVLVMSVLGIDLYAIAQSYGPARNWLNQSITIGVLVLLGFWAFHRWSRQPQRAALGKKFDDALVGGRLRKAQAELDALKAYEIE